MGGAELYRSPRPFLYAASGLQPFVKLICLTTVDKYSHAPGVGSPTAYSSC